ncbi:MAG: DNRLRE domain-containing protein, partial [Chloroflexota bacterium]|nr:DNRLRE domain-containing protein [Chloroflexota bacterium]
MTRRPSNVSIRIFAVVLALWLGIAGVIVPLRDLVPVASAANCLTFSPVADTYVDSGIPRKNFGSSLQLVADGSPASELYLKFEITELSGAVTSAMLRLYVKNASKSGGAVARMSNTSWSEMAVTYDDRPAIDGPDLSSLSAVKVGEWVEFDVLGALTGNGMLGLG